MGHFSGRRRSAQSEPGTHVSKSAADSAAATRAADDSVSRTRADTAAASFAARSSALSQRDLVERQVVGQMQQAPSRFHPRSRKETL